MPEIFEYTETVRAKYANWVEQEFDAETSVDGLTWRRVKGGFGDGRWPREDWIADVPFYAPHISRDLLGGARTSFTGMDCDGKWKVHAGGPGYERMEDAMRASVAWYLRVSEDQRDKAIAKAAEALQGVETLRASQRVAQA